MEVLKGAGSALYGSDAVAATVNVSSLEKPSKELERDWKQVLVNMDFILQKQI